jgi:hypothetical protein
VKLETTGEVFRNARAHLERANKMLKALVDGKAQIDTEDEHRAAAQLAVDCAAYASWFVLARTDTPSPGPITLDLERAMEEIELTQEQGPMP